jgi:hypothetical protein
LKKPDCEVCITLLSSRNETPNCVDCVPPLMEENQEAIFIWGIVRDQVLTAGMDGTVIALNQIPLWEAIDRYKVSNPVQCFEKVRRVFYNLLEKSRLEQDDGN